MAVITEQPVMTANGENLWTQPLTKKRSTNMIPAVSMRNQIPSMPATCFITDGNHWSGPSSVAAVIHMQANNNRKNGCAACLNIVPLETFDVTRSVLG